MTGLYFGPVPEQPRPGTSGLAPRFGRLFVGDCFGRQ